MGEFFCPVRIISGSDALSALSRWKVQRALLVTDPFFSESGTARAVADRLKGARVEIFDRVKPDPPAALAAEGAAICRRLRPELLIALGGGSSLDCAKAIRLASEQSMDFVAIPTTSGSGAEMTSFSILSHGGVKHPLVDPALRPDAAILDAHLLERLPPALIADTGMDLIAHCLEAAVATGKTGFSDALAAHGLRTALACLEKSFRGEKSVRLQLHEAAAMAGMAFDSAGLGILHALAHSLGGAFPVPHGRLCAILIPPVLEANLPAALETYAALARACGIDAAANRLAVRSLSQQIIRLRRNLRLPSNLSEAGIEHEAFKKREEAILDAALADPCASTNPVPVTREWTRRILRSVAP